MRLLRVLLKCSYLGRKLSWSILWHFKLVLGRFFTCAKSAKCSRVSVTALPDFAPLSWRLSRLVCWLMRRCHNTFGCCVHIRRMLLVVMRVVGGMMAHCTLHMGPRPAQLLIMMMMMMTSDDQWLVTLCLNVDYHHCRNTITPTALLCPHLHTACFSVSAVTLLLVNA